jgi:nifR3 family TIM-barrel protein
VYIPLLKIGSLQLEAPLVLAPLAGITDSPFRMLCRRQGAALTYTEMVSAEGIVRLSRKTWDLARFTPEEQPIGIQLFGAHPESLGEAARRLGDLDPDVIDLNFGCPVKKVLRIRAGANYLEDPQRIARAVRSVVATADRPVTVKLRSGPNQERLTAVEAARCAEAEGAAAITIHARTTQQGFSGPADWDIIEQVKAAVKIPVIGNGDVGNPEDMLRMLQQTHCDGVMIGRAVLGNPWIFAACRAALQGEAYARPEPAMIWGDIERHYLAALNRCGLRALREMRKHLAWYSKGMDGSAEFRARIFRLDDPDEVMRTTREFFLQSAAHWQPANFPS